MKLVKSTAIGLVLAAIAHANDLSDQKWEPVCGRFCGEAEACLDKMKGRVKYFPEPSDDPNAEVRLIGEKAPLGIFPWAVAFRSYGNQICGGTIINRKTILTSASCFAKSNGAVNRQKKANTKVYVGFGETLPSVWKKHSNLGDEVYNGRGIFDIKRIDIHRRYKAATGSYDAAVVTIDGSIQYDGSIHPNFEAKYGGTGNAGYSHSRPACFSSGKYDKTYLKRLEDGKHEAQCFTIGYGQDENGQSGTLNYQNETLVINRETCRQRLETLPDSKKTGRLATFRRRDGKIVLDPSYLCTTNGDEEAISCHNDVGSSVQCVNKEIGKNMQPGMVNVGINSWSNADCQTKNVPSINTRVAGISNWVNKMAKRHGGSKAQYTNE